MIESLYGLGVEKDSLYLFLQEDSVPFLQKYYQYKPLQLLDTSLESRRSRSTPNAWSLRSSSQEIVPFSIPSRSVSNTHTVSELAAEPKVPTVS